MVSCELFRTTILDVTLTNNLTETLTVDSECGNHRWMLSTPNVMGLSGRRSFQTSRYKSVFFLFQPQGFIYVTLNKTDKETRPSRFSPTRCYCADKLKVFPTEKLEKQKKTRFLQTQHSCVIFTKELCLVQRILSLLIA